MGPVFPTGGNTAGVPILTRVMISLYGVDPRLTHMKHVPRSAGESKTIPDRVKMARNEEASASCFVNTVHCMAISRTTYLQHTCSSDRNQPIVLYLSQLAISHALSYLLHHQSLPSAFASLTCSKTCTVVSLAGGLTLSEISP